MSFTLETLEQIISQRAGEDTASSYTAQLLGSGPLKPAKKFAEEAVELILASASQGRQEIVSETADVVYHLLVLLRAHDIPLSEIYQELHRRTARSGLAEKASRPQ